MTSGGIFVCTIIGTVLLQLPLVIVREAEILEACLILFQVWRLGLSGLTGRYSGS
jgi:hypothetical protein